MELTLLNQVRLESREGLQVTTAVKDIEWDNLGRDEQFRLVTQVRNAISRGGGGGWRGDARFKNIKIRVKWDPDFVEVLDKEGGDPLPGNEKWYDQHEDRVLEEQERLWHNVWFKTKDRLTDPVVPEEVVEVRVTADFDIERYFFSVKDDVPNIQIGP